MSKEQAMRGKEQVTYRPLMRTCLPFREEFPDFDSRMRISNDLDGYICQGHVIRETGEVTLCAQYYKLNRKPDAIRHLDLHLSDEEKLKQAFELATDLVPKPDICFV
ncbi:hypothetical protein NLI96_g9868 [Meripilus lineatus]|uniref:Uncharacterized protein n=1 Tax=Meripilus lineatus TaxID=2056292 RepID=A0AAD5Y9S7_9APHY|nr:hypothetical protein NLI96_g9868 [Physisporinus lineatus]